MKGTLSTEGIYKGKKKDNLARSGLLRTKDQDPIRSSGDSHRCPILAIDRAPFSSPLSAALYSHF